MTLATLGSILIVLGIAVLAAGAALPIAYALRRAPGRPAVGRARGARFERVSA
jgi:ABC-type Fe3+ transport system permease subunit